MLSFKQRMKNKFRYYIQRGVMINTFNWDDILDEYKEWFKNKKFRRDRRRLKRLYRKINRCIGIKFKYLFEIDTFLVDDPDALKAIEDSAESFEVSYIRALLVFQLCCNKVKGSAEMALRAYKYYKSTDEIKNGPHDYLFDNAFRITKPKRLKYELLEEVAKSPLTAYGMGFTMDLLGKWQVPGIEEICLSYIDIDKVSFDALLKWDDESQDHYEERVRHCKCSLLCRALNNLKYFSSTRNIEILQRHTEYKSDYFDKYSVGSIRRCAGKALKYIEKKSAQSPAAQTPSN